jgi:CheY-like chemotaxis protein
MPSPLIMVIDDDQSIRSALSDLLEHEGYRVLTVADGGRALTHLAQEELPDLILLDLMMPVVDGWKFRAEQMMNPRLASIPVIIITAVTPNDLRPDLGVEIVRKPFDTQALLSLIRSHCPRIEPNNARTAPSRGEALD